MGSSTAAIRNINCWRRKWPDAYNDWGHLIRVLLIYKGSHVCYLTFAAREWAMTDKKKRKKEGKEGCLGRRQSWRENCTFQTESSNERKKKIIKPTETYLNNWLDSACTKLRPWRNLKWQNSFNIHFCAFYETAFKKSFFIPMPVEWLVPPVTVSQTTATNKPWWPWWLNEN